VGQCIEDLAENGIEDEPLTWELPVPSDRRFVAGPCSRAREIRSSAPPAGDRFVTDGISGRVWGRV